MDEKLLADLFVANDQFAELEAALHEFCPFESVGMVNQEIRHGHFLSYIFDPNRPHGFGTDCLRALMAAATRSVGELSTSLSLLEVHLMDFEGATVRREWHKIDVLIEVPDQHLVVAIELKVDATEHSGQLGRYREAVRQEWPDHKHLFLFLTKHGDEPSEEDGEGWLSVDFESLVNELTLVSRRATGNPTAKVMLSAYLAMLRKHHMEDERLERLAASLWTKHKEALDFLADRRPDSYGKLFELLAIRADKISEAISNGTGISVTSDHHRAAALRFAVPSWDQIDGFRKSGFTASGRFILIEIIKASKTANTLRCYFQLGIGDPSIREKLHGCLARDGVIGNKKLTKDWNRLASKAFKLEPMDDETDVEKIASKVESDIVKFVVATLPKFNESLTKLLPAA